MAETLERTAKKIDGGDIAMAIKGLAFIVLGAILLTMSIVSLIVGYSVAVMLALAGGIFAILGGWLFLSFLLNP